MRAILARRTLLFMILNRVSAIGALALHKTRKRNCAVMSALHRADTIADDDYEE